MFPHSEAYASIHTHAHISTHTCPHPVGTYTAASTPCFWKAAGGLIVAACFLPVCFLTRESIGYGDALAAAACGSALGFYDTVCVIELAFMLAFIWALFLKIVRRAGKDDTFPFLPFLTLSYGIGILLL